MSTHDSTKQVPDKSAEPVRTCVGCGAKKPQRQMLRIASEDGTVPVVDVNFRAQGRGAYLCRNRDCMKRALKRRAIDRTLKLKTSAPAAMQIEIERALGVRSDE